MNTVFRTSLVAALASVALISVGSLTACSSTPSQRSTSETLDDAGLTARVKTELAQEQGIGDALSINVDSYRGVVSLSGFLETQDHISKAVQCARRVSGVREVKNNLNVKAKS